MQTQTIPTADVKPGMKFLDTITNTLDPRFREQVVKTVTDVRDEGGAWVTIVGVSDETDYLGNLYRGGPARRLDSEFTIIVSA